VILKKNAADRFSTVLRSWEGETVVLIGGGWSLTREQVELVGQARDRGLVKVGAVNDAYLWAPWADVHYAADAKWHAWHSQGIDKPAIGLKADQVRQLWTSFAGEKCTIQNSGGEVADPAVHVMRNRAGPGLHSVGLSLDPAYLVTGHNSGFQLINLVVLAGAKRIILLGYDGAQNAKTGATHFHGSHPTPTYVGSYEYYRRAFTTAERPLQQAGVEVINCSPGTAIASFRKARFEDVFATREVSLTAEQVRDGVSGRTINRIRVRGGSGLGDAIYIRPVAEYYARKGDEVTVCCAYPEVFAGAKGIKVEGFSRDRIDVLAHYVGGKKRIDKNQWQDIAISAAVPDLALSFRWSIRNRALVDGIRADAGDRPVVLVHGGRAPMGRADGFGKELLPEKRAIDRVLAELGDCFRVRVGHGEKLYGLEVDVDLNGSTSVSDLMDLGWSCDGALGQCSFMIPLCEAFDKAFLAVWAASGMEAHRHPYIKAITPAKIFSKPTSIAVIDTWQPERIREVVNEFRSMVGRAASARGAGTGARIDQAHAA